MATDPLTVVLGQRGDIEEQLTHLARGVLFVAAPDPPPRPLEELEVVIMAAASVVESRARVVQLLPPRVALECADAAMLAAELAGVLAAWPGDRGESFAQWGRMVRGEEAPDEALEAPAPPDEAASSPLYERIKEMSTAEKRQLALHGDKTARTLLLKDPNKLIHAFIIQNKGITLDEVRYIAGFRQTNPEVLKQIGENRDWMQNPLIVTALVSNPKTPSATAVKLLARLPKTELRRIAKSQSVPRAVSAAAKKLVIG